MKPKIFFMFIVSLCLSFFCMTIQAQQVNDPDEIENQIIQLEAQNIDEMSSSVRKLTRESLIELYQQYIESAGNQIALLEKMPDPQGKFGKKREEYLNKRAQIQNRLNQTLKNLNGGQTPKPTESQRTISNPVKSSTEEEQQPVKKPLVPANNGGNTNQNSSSSTKIKSDTNDFKEATPAIVDQVKVMVEIIQDSLTKGEPIAEAVTNDYVELFSFTTALAIEKEDSKGQAIFSLKPISYVFETARTDKQVGASASTMASTSQIDKPGFAKLLGFAIENGLIEKNVQDTVLTLSTSPSALFTFGAENYQTAYQNAGVFNKIGLSASFNINSQNTLLGNATRGQLREFSVRYNFFDRSARSPEFQTIFDRDIAPKIKAQLDAVGAVKEFVDSSETLRTRRNDSEPILINQITEFTNSDEFKALTKEKQKEALTNFISNFMKSEVYAKLHGENNILNEDEKNAFRGKMNNLLSVQKETIFTEARKHLDEFYKKPIATLAYLNHRDPLGNYSEFKFMYERHSTVVKPLSLLLNAGFSFYHKPNVMANQKKMRDITFALSFEGKTRNPFLETENMAPITYSFTGRYTRLFENKGITDKKADLGSFQFLVNIPMFRGIALPLSVTYSNATEMERKSGVRFNFGFKLDTDKIFELARLDRLLGK